MKLTILMYTLTLNFYSYLVVSVPEGEGEEGDDPEHGEQGHYQDREAVLQVPQKVTMRGAQTEHRTTGL